MLTFDEAPNLRRTLDQLTWARDILVVDSFSTDETVAIARSFPQVRLVQRRFDTFAGQCNFGLEQIESEWVLSLDADYVLTDELVEELQEKLKAESRKLKSEAGGWRTEDAPSTLNSQLSTLSPQPSTLRPQPSTAEAVGYRARFRYCIHGRSLRASLYPPRTVLYRRAKAHYRDEGHGHRVVVDGPVRELAGMILHDDRKPLERWLREQDRYARIEAEWLVGIGKKLKAENRKLKSEADASRVGAPSTALRPPSSVHRLSWPDRIRRKIVLAPPLVFFYTLICQGLILDGWPGWYYVFQRTLAEVLLSLRLVEQKLKR